MSQDPFQEREVEKYANPILSRGFILEHLTKREKLASRNELVIELNIEGEEQIETLCRRLRAMERGGQLAFTRYQCYALPERFDLFKGTAIGHRDGYEFLHVEGRRDDLYLSSEQMKVCIHGDQVLAQPLGVDRKGRHEARIVRVLASKTSQTVGRYSIDAGVGFVVPDDSRLSFDILVPPENIMGARMGYVVVAELTQCPTRCTKAVRKTAEVLGDSMGTGMAVDMALCTHEIPYAWPPAVEKQVSGPKEQVPEEAKAGCADLYSLLLVTIDGEDVRDFDDAVYYEKKRGGGWCLWMVIADVSYYVRPGTPLDSEVRSHGTSVYFPSQVVPTLSEVLSNGLRSLSPQVDRLCMVCEMTILSRGCLTGFKFYEAVMSSHARLTYTKVRYMLQDDQELREHYTPLVKHTEGLHNLYKVLESAREECGGILFESEGAKFIFNAERRTERIEQIQRNDMYKLIEECIILANTFAACFVEKAQEPALFHIHDKPSTKAIISFRTVLAELGLELPGSNKPKPRDYIELLTSTTDRPDAEMLQTMLLRSTKQAVCNPENRDHFGLVLQSHVHFTSPIRRYPDLSLHRVIKYLLAKEQGYKGSNTETGGWRYSMEKMLQLGQHCSMTERRADEATHEVSDWLKCDFMQDQVGDVFPGVIANVTGFGFLVRLNDPFTDGLVHVSSLDNDYYRFDRVDQRLIGESDGQAYRLGNRVKVRMEAVNMDERKVDLSLISSERAPRDVGKTTHEKTRKSTPGKLGGRRRQMGKQVNFELDSAFYKEKDRTKAKLKVKKKAKRPSVKTQKIAAATKAKRAAKKKIAE